MTDIQHIDRVIFHLYEKLYSDNPSDNKDSIKAEIARFEKQKANGIMFVESVRGE